jgi:hypothetical protein
MTFRRFLWSVPLFLALAGGVVRAQNGTRPVQPARLDIGKGRVEIPVKNVVAARSSPADAEFANPKVAPGRVKWHASFDAACEAARKSGKPVLLFQMLGKLDDEFC